MSNKLQELTDRLYNEGLSKGKEEGEILLFKARKEADEIIANARKQAEDIVTEAENRAAQLKEKAESDIKMASEQALMATKKDIENLLVNALCPEIQHTAVRRHILSATCIFEKYVGAMGVHRVEKSTQKRNQRRFLEKNQGRFQHWPTKRQLVHQHER